MPRISQLTNASVEAQVRLVSLAEAGQESEAISLIKTMTPIDLVMVQLHHPNLVDLNLWITFADDMILQETACLWAVTGTPPYQTAIDLGLSSEDIHGYLNQWRQVGIDPSEIEYPDPLAF